MNEKKLKLNCLKFILDNEISEKRTGHTDFNLAEDLFNWSTKPEIELKEKPTFDVVPDVNGFELGVHKIDLENPAVIGALKGINRDPSRMKQVAGIDKILLEDLDEDESDFEIDIKSLKITPKNQS